MSGDGLMLGCPLISLKVKMGLWDRKREDEKEEIYDISVESAEKTIEQFLDYYDIYPEDYGEGAHFKAAFNVHCKVLVEAVRRGVLETQSHSQKDGRDEMWVSYTDVGGKKLTFTEITPLHKNQKDYIVDGDSDAVIQAKRVHSILGSLSGMGHQYFLNAHFSDNKVYEALGFLFLRL